MKAIIALLLGLFAFSSKPAVAATTRGRRMSDAEINFSLPDVRGFRNNNPGNIEFSELNPWVGQTGTDGRYATFSHMKFGIRAIGKTLNTYAARYGIRTIRGIIDRWAPDFENDTNSYVNSVAQTAGVSPDAILSGGDYIAVVAGIIKHENGSQPFPLDYIAEAMAIE